MIGIILASHGNLAKEILNAAEMIMGPQEEIAAFALNPEDNPLELKDKFKETARNFKCSDEIIVLVDLLGGSPSNSAAYLAKEGIPVITGMNLPMLLELVGMRSEPVNEAAVHIMECGREGILNLKNLLETS